MGRKRRRRSNFSEDEDNIPLNLIRTNISSSCEEDPNSYNSLCKPFNQPCELCDQVSKNRYTSLIHNIRHIIIPLINQTVHQCKECLHHFTSLSDLSTHKSKRHSLNLVSEICNNLEDGLSNSRQGVKVKQENNVSAYKTNNMPQPVKKVDSITSHCSSSLKNRLLFEEDVISSNCEKLLADLTTDCQVQVECFPQILEVDCPKSVHYDELMKPGVYRCRKCLKIFPNRFSAITHEADHIYFKKFQVVLCNLCNQYILGDIDKLKQHQISSHSESTSRDNGPLKKYFGGRSEENGVIAEPYIKKMTTLKYCHVCFLCCKNNSTRNYDCVGMLGEDGKRYRCEKCGYKYDEVKLVNLVTKYKYSSIAKRRNKKSMTNKDRLKIIAKRFKKLKKAYLFVFFITPHCINLNIIYTLTHKH